MKKEKYRNLNSFAFSRESKCSSEDGIKYLIGKDFGTKDLKHENDFYRVIFDLADNDSIHAIESFIL